MTNNDELERQKFEAWATRSGFDSHRSKDGDYYDFATDTAWQAWMARAKQESNHD